MVKGNRKCPICSSEKSKKIYKQKFADNLFHIISSCDRCGFVFVSNSPGQKYYDNYYKTISKYEHERDEILHRKYCEIISQYCKKDVKILDVGCSTGHLLYQLKRIGYQNISGIDPSPVCKKLAHEKFKIEIVSSDFFSFKAKKKFDLLIFAAVFEHIEQLKKAVQKAYNMLSEGGYLFISVPDLESFGLNYEEPFGEFSTEHINFFSSKDIYRLLARFSLIHMASEDKAILSLWKKSTSTEETVIDYIEKSKRKQYEINKTIRKLPDKIMIWGAGSLTQRLLSQREITSKVQRFIDRDNNLIGKKLNGIPIISPDNVKSFQEPILVSSFRFKEEIKKDIKKMKLRNKVIMF